MEKQRKKTPDWMTKPRSIFDSGKRVSPSWFHELGERIEATGKPIEEVKDEIEAEMQKEKDKHLRDLEWRVERIANLLKGDSTLLVIDSGENDFEEIRCELASQLSTGGRHLTVSGGIEQIGLWELKNEKELWQKLQVCDPEKALWVMGIETVEDEGMQEIILHMMMRDNYAPSDLSFCPIDFSRRKILLFHNPKETLDLIPSYCRENPLKISVAVI